MSTNKRPGTYADVIPRLQAMSEVELLAAIEAEVNAPRPRVDLLVRLAARFNRARGARFMEGMLALLSKKGRRGVGGIL